MVYVHSTIKPSIISYQHTQPIMNEAYQAKFDWLIGGLCYVHKYYLLATVHV